MDIDRRCPGSYCVYEFTVNTFFERSVGRAMILSILASSSSIYECNQHPPSDNNTSFLTSVKFSFALQFPCDLWAPHMVHLTVSCYQIPLSTSCSLVISFRQYAHRVAEWPWLSPSSTRKSWEHRRYLRNNVYATLRDISIALSTPLFGTKISTSFSPP